MVEIERKWLVKNGYEVNMTSLLWVSKSEIQDWYATNKIRIRNKNNDWSLTIKGNGTIKREEKEYQLKLNNFKFPDNYNILKKTRIVIPYNNQNFEVNVFNNILYKDKPLVLIELELEDQYQIIDLPEWVGEEVTYDERFYGYNLANFLKFKDFSIS